MVKHESAQISLQVRSGRRWLPATVGPCHLEGPSDPYPRRASCVDSGFVSKQGAGPTQDMDFSSRFRHSVYKPEQDDLIKMILILQHNITN